MTSKLKTDALETASGTGSIALNNQFSGMTADSMPVGSVVQVVTHSLNTSWSTTSISFVVTDASVSITPKFSNSKMAITISGSTHAENAVYLHGALYKDGVSLSSADELIAYSTSSGAHGDISSLTFHNTVSSINPTTFAYYVKSSTGGLVYFYRNVSITVMEIKQ